jgi:hypothetical protein
MPLFRQIFAYVLRINCFSYQNKKTLPELEALIRYV